MCVEFDWLKEAKVGDGIEVFGTRFLEQGCDEWPVCMINYIKNTHNEYKILLEPEHYPKRRKWISPAHITDPNHSEYKSISIVISCNLNHFVVTLIHLLL